LILGILYFVEDIMIVRCENHAALVQKKHYARARSVNPVGYPHSAAICGRCGCKNPGRVLLQDHEWKRYQRGERIFAGRDNFTKVRVE
jgi:hypothetical protein